MTVFSFFPVMLMHAGNLRWRLPQCSDSDIGEAIRDRKSSKVTSCIFSCCCSIRWVQATFLIFVAKQMRYALDFVPILFDLPVQVRDDGIFVFSRDADACWKFALE